MHKILVAAILGCLPFVSFAQALSQGQTTTTGSDAAAINSGVRTEVNNVSNGTPYQYITNTGDVRYHSNQAASGPSVYGNAGSPVNCADPSTGGSLGLPGANLGLNFTATKDIRCKTGMAMNIVTSVEAAYAESQRPVVLVVATADKPAVTVKADDTKYQVLKGLACNVEEIADGYEVTERPCPDVVKRSDRAQRKAQRVATAPTTQQLAASQPVALLP